MAAARVIRMAVAVVSDAVLLSAIVVIVLALRAKPQPAYFLAAFEVVTAVSGVVGMGLALAGGCDRVRLAAGLACIAGGIALCSGLGAFGAGWTVAGHSLRPLVGGRLLAAAILGAAAAWSAIAGNPKRALARLGIGAGLGAMFVLLVGLAWVGRGRIGALPPGVRFLGGILAMLVATGLLAAAVHWMIAGLVAGVRPDGRSAAEPDRA